MKNKFIAIILWIFSFELVGFLLGKITQSQINTWYQTLNKSLLTPPSIIFPIVWGILYAMLAIAGWSLWQQKKHPKAKFIFSLFMLQMLMNFMWTPLFFYFHWIMFAYFWLLAMVLITFTLILMSYKHFKLFTMMLIPYQIWLIFACYLNAVIAFKN